MTQTLFILSLFKHGFKVRWTTAYFVLIGKKTNSVITYATCYQLLPFFHLFPNLKKERMLQYLKELENEGDLTLAGDYVQLTQQGMTKCQELNYESLHHINRFEDYQVCQDTFERWLLICQLVSQKSYKQTHYIPVSRQFKIQKQIQYQWSHTGISFETFQSMFKQEIKKFMRQFSPRVAYIYAYQLSGYKVIAKTNEQLSEILCIPEFEVNLWIESLKSILCQLSTEEFPWLSYFIAPQLNPKNTLYFLIKSQVQQGVEIQKISEKVHRKPGTVLDYIVEIAIKENDFPFSTYIGMYQIRLDRYLKTHPNFGDWNYQSIQEEIGEIPFYAYRLYQIQKGRFQC